MRYCLDCGTSLQGMHGNTKRCIPCQDAHHKQLQCEAVKRSYKRHPESRKRNLDAYKKRHPDRLKAYQATYFQEVTKPKRTVKYKRGNYIRHTH